ncbi:MAG: S26 family signal peptidase [Chloroflexota bacterium]
MEGPSMEPTLREGDWLLVDPDAFARRPPALGDLVLAPDLREDDQLLIKRRVDQDGRLTLAGDDPEHSTDSRVFGSVDPASVVGAPWFRYWPLRRVGHIR